ncbi:MAG: hypothetical protein ACKOA8_20605, partial [Deltaproteobacteria bacterium]
MTTNKDTHKDGTKDNRKEALDYHSSGRPGKIEVISTKSVKTSRDDNQFLTYEFICPEIIVICRMCLTSPSIHHQHYRHHNQYHHRLHHHHRR